jgi:cobalamin-dependent methionine synthase I
MFDRIEAAFEEAEKLIDAKGVFIIRQIKEKGNLICLQNSQTTILGQSAKDLLKNSFAVIFMAVTIGSGLEKLTGQYTKEKQFENALVLDTIGSEAAEASANALNSYLLTLARQAKNTLTRRFSPGYGDLPLTFQNDMYRELSLDRLKIVLDKKHILFPRKTVTAIIGVEE